MEKENLFSTLEIVPDKTMFIVVSCLLFLIFSFLGVMLFLCLTSALIILPCICFFYAVLPFITWKKYYHRKVVLSKGKITVYSKNQSVDYSFPEIKVITVGMHAVFYFTNGKRFVIRYSSVKPQDIRRIDPAWPCIRHNGDLRFLFLKHLVLGTMVLLIIFDFISGVGFVYTLYGIAVLSLVNLLFYFVKYLWLD